MLYYNINTTVAVRVLNSKKQNYYYYCPLKASQYAYPGLSTYLPERQRETAVRASGICHYSSTCCITNQSLSTGKVQEFAATSSCRFGRPKVAQFSLHTRLRDLHVINAYVYQFQHPFMRK